MTLENIILMKNELSLLLIIFLLLIIKIWDGIKNNSTVFLIVNILLTLNFIIGFIMNKDGVIFNEMYHTNSVLSLEKNILNLGTLIISIQSYGWQIKNKNILEFYILLLSTLLGLSFMVSSGNFLMFYLALELASIPLAALTNFDLNKQKSAEAAMKMILSSAFASGILLFGISLLYGATGSITFSELTKTIQGSPLEIAALLFIFSGFAFKLSSVPFHFWTADVYEGAPLSITSFLSVISKSAIVFAFISILIPLLSSIIEIKDIILLISIVLTILIGNLFALRQTNFKRFIAFSSIAQVGFILLGLFSGNTSGFSATIYFLIVYIFSNLGILGVLSIVIDRTGMENISDYKGFYKSNPLLSWILAIALFSLAGIPPTAGFFGKMFLITSGTVKNNYGIIVFAAFNMVLSLFYYLKIIKTVFIDKNEHPIQKLKINTIERLGLFICLSGIIVAGIISNLYEYIYNLLSF